MRWLGNRFDEGPPASVSRGTPLKAKLFGLGIGALGLVLLSPLVVFDVRVEGGAAPIWLYIILIALGLPPFLIGLYFVIGRNGVIVDHDANRVEAWRGLIVPIWRWRYELGHSRRVVLSQVRLSHGPVTGGRFSYTFGVTLSGKEEEPIQLDLITNELAARRFAERAARTLGLPMENRLASPTDVRSVEALDQPLAERIREAGIPDVPALRPNSRLRVEPGGPERRLTLLPARSTRSRGESLFVAAIVGVIAWWLSPVLLDAEAPAFLKALVGTVVLAAAWAIFGDLLVTTAVTVSPETLRVRKSLVGPLARSWSFPLGDIEELYFDGLEIRVISDAAACSFASGHTEADGEATEALLRGWVAALHFVTHARR